MEQGLVCELNGKQMNWVAYAGWTNQKQFQQRRTKDPKFYKDWNIS